MKYSIQILLTALVLTGSAIIAKAERVMPVNCKGTYTYYTDENNNCQYDPGEDILIGTGSWWTVDVGLSAPNYQQMFLGDDDDGWCDVDYFGNGWDGGSDDGTGTGG